MESVLKISPKIAESIRVVAITSLFVFCFVFC